MMGCILKTAEIICKDPEAKLCSKDMEMAIQDSIRRYFGVKKKEEVQTSKLISGIKARFPWQLQMKVNWSKENPIIDVKPNPVGTLTVELPMVIGSYEYNFLINGVTFCDTNRPFR